MTTPTAARIRDLPVSLVTQVRPEHVDVNGHLNVRHHVALHDDGGWALFAGLGLTPERVEEGRRNFFDLEHHVRYLAEARLGERLSVHHRLLGRTAKTVHLMSYLVDDTTDAVASTIEIVTVMVDLDTRRAVPLADPELGPIDTRLAADAALAWDPGLGGTLGLRH